MSSNNNLLFGYDIPFSPLLLFWKILLIMVIMVCILCEKTRGNLSCYQTISVSGFNNQVSDSTCSISQHAISNIIGGIEATFTYTPTNRKIILGKDFRVQMKHMFSPCIQSTHVTSLYINEQFIMNLPFEYNCETCPSRTFYLNAPITRYLELYSAPELNTLKINSTISTSSRIFIADVSFSYCTIPEFKSMADLQIQTPTKSVDLLTNSSVMQVDSEPFKDLFVSGLSSSTTTPLIITNNAVDIVDSLDLSVSLTNSHNVVDYIEVEIVSVEKVNILTNQSTIISPSITKYVTSNSIKYSFSEFTLSHNEQIIVMSKLFLNRETAFFTTNVLFRVDVNSTTTQELKSSDNTISLPFNIYNITTLPSEMERPAGNIYSARNLVSDLAYFTHTPKSSSEHCWLQLNFILTFSLLSALNGNIYFWSSHNQTQTRIPFQRSDFIGNTLFLSIPTNQLDCTSTIASTTMFLRTEASTHISYRLYLSRKTFSVVSDTTPVVNNIFTPTLEQGEAFGILVGSLYGSSQNSFQRVPLIFELSDLPSNSQAQFYAFQSQKSSTITMMSLANSVSVPTNLFPNDYLFPDTVLYYYEHACTGCTTSLTITYPQLFRNPVKFVSSPITETQTRNKYGIYWKFVEITNNSPHTYLYTTATMNSPTDTVSNITLIATSDKIDEPFYNRILSNSVDHFRTSNCINSTQAQQKLGSPVSSGVWKFGFIVDPSISFNTLQFHIQSVSLLETITRTDTRWTTRQVVRSNEFMYTMKIDCSSEQCKSFSKLRILFMSSSLQINDRKYDIYLKFGSKPTIDNYDIKKRLSGLVDTDSVSEYEAQYIFTKSGALVFGESIQFLPNGLHSEDPTIYILFKEVPQSYIPILQSCAHMSTIPTFRYLFFPEYNFDTFSKRSLTTNSIFYLTATSVNFNEKIGKNLTLEITTQSVRSLSPLAFNPLTNETLKMQRTLLSYSVKGSPSLSTSKYAITIPISQQLIDILKKGYPIAVRMGDGNEISLGSSETHIFVEQDFDYISYFTPTFATIGVVGIIFILLSFYMILCYIFIAFSDFKLKTKSMKDIQKSTMQHWFLIPFSVFLFGFVCCLSSCTGSKKSPTRIIYIVLGCIFLVLSALFYGSMLGSQLGLITNSPNENSKLSSPSNVYHYACCRYSYPEERYPYNEILRYMKMGGESSLFCFIDRGSSFSNLEIDNSRHIASDNNYTFVVGGSGNIIRAKTICPRSELLIVPASVDGINAISSIGVCFGTIFLFFALFYSTEPCCEKAIKTLKKKRKDSSKSTSTITTLPVHATTNTIATNSINNSYYNYPSNPQEEFIRREQELVAAQEYANSAQQYSNAAQQYVSTAQPYSNTSQPYPTMYHPQSTEQHFERGVEMHDLKYPSVPTQSVYVKYEEATQHSTPNQEQPTNQQL